MMKYSHLKIQKGVGLIEVLIATVVIAIGLLAVASLQSGFIFNSGENKMRAEALTIAEQRIELLRNNVTLVGFDARDDSTATVTGTNATFSRSDVITQGGTVDRLKVSVIVTWDGDGGVDSDGDGNIIDENERINVVTEMNFIDPAKSALIAAENGGGGTGAVPSPRQNASEDVNAASENVVGTNLDIVADAGVVGTAGIDSNLNVELPGGGTFLVYQVAPNSHFYTATTGVGLGSIEDGVIAVFLCDGGVCSHIQNHFGGVVHRIKGTVYSTSGNGLSGVLVAWTSSDVNACYVGTPVRNPLSGTFIYDSMPYECVNAGNCNVTDPGTRTATGINQGCFIDGIVSDDQINARNVGPGGEFGDVGLLGLDFQGGGQEQVCFLEDTVDPNTSPLLNTSGSDVLNENYLFAVTKRFYITRRIERNGSINDHKSEGINRSYINHNFFIIDKGNGATAKAKCNLVVALTADTKQQIAPREISRAHNEGTDNKVIAEGSYSGGTGTAHTLTGNVTGSATDLRFFIPETGTCYLNNALNRSAAATGYACAVANDVVSAEIIGSSEEYRTSNPSVFASCTKAANTTPGCHWITDFTNTYDDGGSGVTNCTTPWGDDVVDTASVMAYSEAACSIGITRTCNSGTLDGDPTAIHETEALCDAALLTASCTSPFIGGPDIASGDSVDAFTMASVAFGSTCPTAVTRACTSGTLSGDVSATFQSCTVLAAICTIPNYVGTRKNSLPAQWNAIGPGNVSFTTPSGNPQVVSQTPTPGGTNDCTQTVTVTF